MSFELEQVYEPVTLLVMFSVLLISWYLLSGKSQNLPPGPKPWPLVGNIPYLKGGKKKPLYTRIMDLYSRYGEIVRLKVGTENLVLIFGSKMIHKAAVEQNESFRFRPVHVYAFRRVFNERGVHMGNGDVHTALRKFTVVALKDFGVGKKTLEERIHEENEKLSDVLRGSKGKPTDFSDTFKAAVANIISSIVYGSRHEYGDARFKEIIDINDSILENLDLIMPENEVPFLEYLPGSKLSKVLAAMNKLRSYTRSQIKEHRDTFDPNNIRDFVDLYLQNESSDNEYITEDSVFNVIVELFNAGTETTSIAITWAILYLIKYPAMQEKCRAEIHQVVGTGRMVSFQDREKLPYLQAIICETLRRSVIVMMSPRCVIKATKFAGYDLPKNTIVLLNLYSALMDPGYWKDPEEFRPERFLDQKGHLNMSQENYIPMGLGGRMCLGKELAKMQLFIFLGTLLQRFRFEKPAGSSVPDTAIDTDGAFTKPPKYEVCAKLC